MNGCALPAQTFVQSFNATKYSNVHSLNACVLIKAFLWLSSIHFSAMRSTIFISGCSWGSLVFMQLGHCEVTPVLSPGARFCAKYSDPH